jgi:catechol 2,3-dioxygenase-like lactoylglutathione lyase family enzyme
MLKTTRRLTLKNVENPHFQGLCGDRINAVSPPQRRASQAGWPKRRPTFKHEESMKRTWTIIGVADVPQSFKWYQSLLGLPETAPAHDYFGQIVDSDGTVLLCLHKWGAHEHPSLTSPHYATHGNGLLLFFRVDNFDEALLRGRSLVSRLEEEPHVNPNTRTAEFSLRDPDGYYVTISALNQA